MKLCILGPKKRTDMHLSIIEKAKKHFDKVLYASLSNVRIESTGEDSIPYYKNTNLFDFNALLPLVPKTYSDFGFVITKLFEEQSVYTPIRHKTIFYSYNEFLVPIFLKKAGIKTPKTYFSMSRDALNSIIPELKYPVMIKLPYQKKGSVVLDSEESVRGFTDTMESLSQPILMQENYEEYAILNNLVIGNKLYTLWNKNKVYKMNPKNQEVIFKTARLLNTSVCQVNAVQTKEGLFVHGIDINPKINVYEQIFQKDITSELMKHILKKAKIFSEGGMFTRFFDWLDDLKKS